MARIVAAMIGLVAALVGIWSRMHPTGSSQLQIAPNGGGESFAVDIRTWREDLHRAYPNASRIGLWTGAGVEQTYTERDGMSGGSPSGTLYAVVDAFPFVWPPHSTRVDVGDRWLDLEALSSAPRAFIAHNALSAEECAAILRLAEPKLAASTTLVQGSTRVDASPRNSDSAWLRPPAGGAPTGSDEEAQQNVLERIARLVRLPSEAAEPMQVLRYTTNQHFFYHTDTGGAPSIAGRALTALLYLNDGFEGGGTNFALAGGDEPRRNVHRVREEFNNCQTERGLTVRPRRGSILLFYNLDPNSADKSWWTWHCSADVVSGEKRAANLWYHLSLIRRAAERRRE